MQFKVLPYGEQALLISFKAEISTTIHLQVKSVYETLEKLNIEGVTGFIPAYNSITVCFLKDVISFKELSNIIKQTDYKNSVEKTNAHTVKIPVCYELGLDIKEVSEKTKLSFKKIISLHTAKPYLVYMMGFTPGFMYLGGLDSKLFVPRKNTPRLKIEPGSVGLADQQTGIYPLETPGGWQIIGKTPLKLFDKNKKTLVKMGDFVKFYPISVEEFYKLNQYD